MPDVSIVLGVDGEREFRNAIQNINSQIKNFDSEMKALVSGFDSLEDAESSASQRLDILGRSMDAQKQKITTLSAQYDRQVAKLRELQTAAEKASSAEYSSQAEKEAAITKANNAYNRQASVVNKLSAQINQATAALNSMEKEFRDVEQGADAATKSFQDTGEGVSGIGAKLKGGLAVGAAAITGLIAGAQQLVEVTMELGSDFSRLEQNAKNAGIGLNSAREELANLYALSGETDSSVEALSNLLSTGFDDNGIAQAVEALSGAVIKFPDTLNLESLADGLQETLATGTATGQFGELLDRLGIGAENFSQQLAGCSTEAERQQLVLETLAKAGLNDTYKEYEKNNKAMMDYRKSSLELKQALSGTGEAILPVFTTINKALTGLVEGFSSLAGVFQEGGFGAVFDVLLDGIKNFSSMLLENLPQIAETGAEIIKTIVLGIIQAIPFLVQSIPQILTALLGALGALTVGLLQAGIELGGSLLSGIGQALLAAGQYIASAFQPVVAFFSSAWEGIKAIFNGVQSFFADIFSQAAQAVQSAWSSITSFFAGVWSGIQAIFAVVQSVLGGFFTAAAQTVQSVWNGVTSFFAGVWSGIQAIFSVVQSVLGGFFSGAANTIRSVWNGITSFFSGVWNQIKGVFSDVTSTFLSIGRNIVNGIKNGIANGWNSLVSWLKGKLSGMVDTVLSFFGIHSPSRVFMEIGEYLMEGLKEGIDTDVAEKAMTKRMKSLSGAVSSAFQTIRKELLGDQEDLNKSILKKGEEAAELLNDKLVAKEEELAKRLEETGLDEATKESLNAQLSAVKEFRSEYEKALQDIQQSQESMADKLQEYGDLFETIKTETGSFIELGDLQADIDAINRYGDALESLKDRGISDSLLGEITGMSVDDALTYTDQLLNMTDDQYAKYMGLWEEKQKAADEIARKFYQDEMTALTEEFTDKLPEELSGIKDDMRSVGVNSIQGMIDGIKSMSGTLAKAARQVVANAIAAMRAEADIHSPSKKTRNLIGVPMAEGVEVGFWDYMDNLKRTMANAVMAPVQTITRSDLYGATAGMVNGMAAVGASTGATQPIVIQVNLSNKQIAEVLYDPLKQVGKQRGY